MNKIYSRLAFTNIKNNKTLYMPYIISGMVMIAMFYVMMFLNNSKGLGKVPGAETLVVIMGLGCGIIAIFSYIFLFYTNSFIIKRRKKEVGIYNILGMEKRHIARVLIIETLTVALAAIASGIIAGILFSKLMIMFLYRIINIKAQINFAVSTSAVVNTILIFGVLYFLTLIYNLMQVKLANPIELLRGGNVGEKEPKSKWLIAIIGLGCLAGGYYIAITTKSPLQVLSLFFVAVLLVIVGTYLLFISGSIVILKALRKNKKFYYNKKHFAAVSGMIYRMKQNAGGLASICVLSTMVLVVVSTTVSMYAGMEGELKQRYPSDISVYSWYKEVPADVNLDDALKEAVGEKNASDIIGGAWNGDIRSKYSFGDTLSLNDLVSDNFMLNNAKGDVYLIIADNARIDSTLNVTEIERLLKMEDVKSINGIEKSKLLSMTSTDRFNILKEQSVIDIMDAKVYRNTDGFEILSFEGTKYESIFKTNISPDYINVCLLYTSPSPRDS